MGTVRVIFLVLFAILWLLLTSANYWALYLGITKRKHVSPIPLIGTLAGAAFLVLLPVGSMAIRTLFLPMAMAADPQLWGSLSYFLVRGFPKQK